ncbi:4-hydroxybenzoate octaprenyltransferase [Ottowia sp. SB7-C50]|uniref:4-hydroxybenzoate octaprenyltransferase n=1 Tax=Ottowia sp. SB7-C50 TaxID=3081231 RepID=UPI0029547130|nr:4-hydroxybenzoate octaprenyltransferase [Ottowia sp. SB7-C50]WOP15194.1 4-hydroxybenzoate octaprenyltransferase [Ottowia sp. SB7-C50]
MVSTPPSAPPRSRLSLYLDLIRWDRPAGWLVLYWPTLGALWLAAGGWPGWHLFIVFTLGTVLMRSAGCCINDVADRDFDRHVKRTAQRPITSGLVSVREALALGAVLAAAAFALALTTTWAVIAWSVPALLVTIVYPFTKRFFAMPQAVLGIAFGFGIPMAYAAVRGSVPLEALWLFLGKMALVLAYDTEYAMVDRDDDLKIGMKTSAITLGRADVAAVMGFFALYLAIWWSVSAARLPALWPLALGFAVAAAQVAWHYTLIRTRTREGCFVAFKQSHWIGAAVFAGIAAAFALGRAGY